MLANKMMNYLIERRRMFQPGLVFLLETIRAFPGATLNMILRVKAGRFSLPRP